MQFPRSALMLGCAPLGGLYHTEITIEHNTRPVLRRTIIHHNIHDIDTAPWYGHGKSESDIGKILESDAELQNQPVRIFTKVGRVIKKREQCQETDPRAAFGDTCYKVTPENKDVIPFHDYTDNGIKESIKQSITRLRVFDEDTKKLRNSNHRIVCLRLHDCDTEDRFTEATKFDGISALMRFCSASTQYQPSIGMNEPEQILKILKWVASSSDAYRSLHLLKMNRFHSVMMAGSWNLMDQSGMLVLEFCERHEIEVHNAGIFGGGLLWTTSDDTARTSSSSTSPNVNYRYRQANQKEIEKRNKWEAVARELGVSLPALAFAFAFLPVAVTKICFGASTADQVDANVAAADEAMTKLLVDETLLKKMVLLANKKGLFDDNSVIGGGIVGQCMIWIEKKAKMMNCVSEGLCKL